LGVADARGTGTRRPGGMGAQGVRAPGREPAGREVMEPTSYTEFRRQAERLLGM